MLALMVLFDQSSTLPLLLLAMLLHELGHLGALLFLGQRPHRFHLGFLGLRIDYGANKLGYLKEALIALAGPGVNLLLAYGFAFFGGKMQWEYGFFFSGMNLGIALFNLLPIFPLDGGRGLYCFLAWIKNAQWAEGVGQRVSFLFICLLFSLGLWIFILSRWNFSLLAISIWLCMFNQKRQRREQRPLHL